MSPIDKEIGDNILLIQSVAFALHIPYFFCGGTKIVSNPVIGYGGKVGTETGYAQWIWRSWGIWAFICGVPGIAMYNDNFFGDPGIPDDVLFCAGFSNMCFAVFWAMSVFGFDGGAWKSGEPTFMNKIMLGSWIPLCGIFGFLMFLSSEIDEVGDPEVEFFDVFCELKVVDPVVDCDVGKNALLLLGLMLLAHVIPFMLFADKFMSFPMAYAGKEGMNGQTNTACRGYGFFSLFLGSQMLSFYTIGGANPSVYLCYGLGMWLFAMWFAASLLVPGVGYLSTKPNFFNKLMLAAWVPLCFLFGLLFILSADFDEIPMDVTASNFATK